jgi:WD40 repeat protein/serine/threonine protein kinase
MLWPLLQGRDVSASCPSEQDLLAFHRGILQEDELDVIAEHLESCPGCEATIRLYDRKADPLVDVMRMHIQAHSTLLSGHWTKTTVPKEQRSKEAADPTARENWPKLPGYEIVGVLGRGGMGVVYQARHRALNRLVALKHLQTGTSAKTARSRLEAEALAGLHHPNIVQIHEIVEHESDLFLSLELIEGGSLADHLEGKPQLPRATARLLETVAWAVEHAHSRGIIHRDLKPANILLSRESNVAAGTPADDSRISNKPLDAFVPRIADFGLAKRLVAPADATLEGDIIGTPSYMAPEQAAGKGENVGPRTDIYSLGVILYEMVTGRVPLQGPNTLETLVMVCESEPVPPRRIQPKLARDLETICLKCLQKEPSRRYASAAELAEDLRRFQATEPIVARPTTLWERGWKWTRRRPAPAALLALSLVVLTVGFPLVFFLWLRADGALAQVSQSRNQLESAVYADNISLADHNLQSGAVTAARSFLDKCIPASERPDLRGWEWQYLRRLSQADRLPGIGHEDKRDFWVSALSFHPSNRYFVSAAGLPNGAMEGRPANAQYITPGEVKVWELATGHCLATLTGHGASIQSVAFSPDGHWLATGAADGTVRLWDGLTFAPRSTLPTQKGAIFSLAFSPDCRSLAIGCPNSVVIWDLLEERLRPNFAVGLSESSHGPNLTLVFNPQGDGLAAGWTCNSNEDGLRIWDPRTGQPVPHGLPPGRVAGLAYSHDGRYLATSDGSDRIHVWRTDGSGLYRRLSTHADGISSLMFCPDGRLVSGGEDRTLRVWNVDHSTVEAEFRGHELGILCVAVSRDGLHLASADKVAAVKLWDLRRNPGGVSFNVCQGNGEYLGHLAFSDDGRNLLAVADLPEGPGHHYLEVRDPSTSDLRSRLTLRKRNEKDGLHRVFAFSGDSRRLCGSDWADRSLVRIYETHNAAEVAISKTSDVPVMALAMTHDGACFARSGWNLDQSGAEPILRNELSIHDSASGRSIRTIRLPPMHIATQLAFSPDGRMLAASIRATFVQDGRLLPRPYASVYLRDVAGEKEPFLLDDRHEGPITGLAFSPDGTRLASVGLDHTLRVVDVLTGHPVFPAATVSGGPTSVAFSPDGRRLAVAGMDGTVRLWDAANGNALLSLRGFGPPGGGHYGFTARLAFSPDGTRLASNDWDGTVTIWDATPVR